MQPVDLQQVNSHWTLFLDRDGVINHEKEGTYVLHYGEFTFLDRVKDALQICATIFGRIVIVTNQRGIGKGMMTAQDLAIIHDKMVAEIVLAGQAVRAMGEALGRPVTKLNVAQLGNVTRQLHIHVIGRRPEDDAAGKAPVWGVGVREAYTAHGLAAAIEAARAIALTHMRM